MGAPTRLRTDGNTFHRGKAYGDNPKHSKLSNSSSRVGRTNHITSVNKQIFESNVSSGLENSISARPLVSNKKMNADEMAPNSLKRMDTFSSGGHKMSSLQSERITNSREPSILDPLRVSNEPTIKNSTSSISQPSKKAPPSKLNLFNVSKQSDGGEVKDTPDLGNNTKNHFFSSGFQDKITNEVKTENITAGTPSFNNRVDPVPQTQPVSANNGGNLLNFRFGKAYQNDKHQLKPIQEVHESNTSYQSNKTAPQKNAFQPR